MVCIWWTLRACRGSPSAACWRASSRATGRPRWRDAGAQACDRDRRIAARSRSPLLGARADGGGAAGAIDRTGAFFGAGSVAARRRACASSRSAAASVAHVARAATAGGRCPASASATPTDRPGRSVLAIAVIASATFILISVDAFRRGAPSAADRHSGVGGYPLLVDLLLPLAHDPEQPRRPRGARARRGPRRSRDRAVPGAARATMRAA